MQVDPIGCGAELAQVIAGYEGDAAGNGRLYRAFEQQVNAIPELRAHRDFVDREDWGYGDRAFYYQWKLLVDAMPSRFRFLEIGVYKGQILSLIELLRRRAGKQAEIVGVTPLSEAGDKYSKHDKADYLAAIHRIYAEFGLDTASTTLIKGLSQTPEVLALCAERAPFDIIYVDGCHDVEVVTLDLMLYPTMLKPGGYLVIDDASFFVDLPAGLCPGLPEVSLVAREIIEPDPQFEHCFACGHNRVWRKRMA